MPEKLFTASFSGGKDSTFALYKATKMSLKPVSLITTFNTTQNRSWFHGIEFDLLEKISNSLGIPLELVKTNGDDYIENFENMLSIQRNKGAEICVFGDIDIPEHIQWNQERAVNSGLEPLLPLLGLSRREIVSDFIKSGFKAMINVIDTRVMDRKFLGETLTWEIANEIEQSGADICGENGEYHTIVYDGPIFSDPIKLSTENVDDVGNYGVVKVRLT